MFCSRCGVDVTLALPDDATVPMTTGGSPIPSGDSGVTLRTRLREATLGEYEILEELGRGGMATVFRAHDISLDRKVAIKVMAPHLLEGEGMVERFKLEARTAAQLSHPHIIPIYAVKESASTLFFVMKYVEGRALDEIIARTGQLPIAMVKDILIKVGGALGYAHRRGVVHRDVKPGNIMIDDEATPIVTDFGIAKLTTGATGLTVTGTTIGTPSYMSPEQCEAKEVTGASDQYSLGIVAFQMLTGRLPFEGDSPVTVMYKHCHEELPPLHDYRPDCPPDVLETVNRMVAKDPAERWPSMEAAIQKLSVTGSTEAYLDPVRKELVRAAKEGDFERLAELSTGGNAISGGAAESTPGQGTPAVAGGRSSGRRWGLVGATLLFVTAVGTVAVLQPWSGGAVTPEEGLAGAEGGTDGAPSESGGPGVVPTDGETDGPADGGSDAGGSDPEDGGGDVLAAGEDPAVEDDSEPATTGSGDTPPAAARLVVSDVRVTGPGSLTPGETAVLSAVAFDQRGDPIPAATVSRCETHGWSQCGVRWSSDAAEVATVSGDGTVTALAQGTATLTATIGGETGRWRVDVSAVPAAEVRVSPSTLRLVAGDQGNLSADVLGPSGEVLSGRSARWSSANPAVAGVGQDGVVQGAGPGRTTLTASADGASATVAVTVVEDPAEAVPLLVEAFGNALAAEDLASARTLFPGMEPEVEQRFTNLFAAVQMQAVRLDVEALTASGETAEAVLRGVYVFEDPRAGSQELAIVLSAAFALANEGIWRLTRWDQVEND